MTSEQQAATGPGPATAPEEQERVLSRALLFKLLLELGPLLVFLGAFQATDIYGATVAFMAATVLSVGWSVLRQKRVPLLPLITLAVILLFGGLTLVFTDPTFILIRPAFVNGTYAVLFLASLATSQPLLARIFGDDLSLTDEGWRKLTARTGFFMLALALINEVTWRGYGVETWVWFKSVGLVPLNLAFGLAQLPLVRAERPPAAQAA